MKKTDWKEEMDNLYKRTIKNWKKTGNVKKCQAVTGSISLKSENKND